MAYWNRGYEYPGTLIYVMAMYSFYSITMAIINLIKYRKIGSPVLNAVKVVSLSAAMVSILALETAMLSQFGKTNGEAFRQVMVLVTGIGVCTIVLMMAISMVIYTSRKISFYGSN